MAAEVSSSLIRVLAGYKDEDSNRTAALGNSQESSALVTRDLLGQSSNLADSQELDLDLQVPSGWEKRLDLKSGKVYIQRSQTPDSPLNSDSKQQQMINQTESKFQDLNFPPSPSKRTLNLFNETSLDLKLTSSPSPSSSTNYASVCTLDKVKSALERADKELVKKRTSLWKSSSSPSYSSSSSSAAKEIQEEEAAAAAAEIRKAAAPMAVGCPGCLSYVLVMKNNPRCPRCNSVVPLPNIKKPRIDLNMSI